MLTLMGAETEYAITVLDRQGNLCDPEASAQSLLRLVKQRLPCLASADGQGVFLANGGKFYIDVGCHPEYATPECPDPWDLVRYTLAGDRIVARLARELEASRRHSRVLVFRGNTGYGASGESWACHESFLCRRSPAEYKTAMLPFLTSRVIFGSGGFNPFSPGIEFTLSPRSHFITTVSNSDTMHSRPILNLRDEPLAQRGYHRLHLICADAVGSEAAMWLRAGTTAIVVGLIDGGCRLQIPSLKDPLAAMRAFAADPTLCATAQTVEGAEVSALDIQRQYLEQACRYLPTTSLPDWAPLVLEGWGRMLDVMCNEKHRLDIVLDWSIKRTIYSDFCESIGVSWKSLPAWSRIVSRLEHVRANTGSFSGPLTLDAVHQPSGPLWDVARSLDSVLAVNGLEWEVLPQIVALRSQLFELDTKYLQLGGLFHNLDEQGALDHKVLTDAGAIDRAVFSPPDVGRAAIRGKFVREMAGTGKHRAGWSELIDARAKQLISLSDPFCAEANWPPVELRPACTGNDGDIACTLAGQSELLGDRRVMLEHET